MAKKWLDKYNDGGPIQPNYNDAKASTGPGYVGSGYDTTGRNYSPAWGGQFQDGGKLTLPEAIVYGHKDPKVKDYFDKVRTDAEKWRDEYYWNTPTAGYHALEQMHNKYGAPKINTIGEKDRAYYNPITDSMNISIPKYGDEYGDPVEDQFLHELAHKVQANKKGNVGFVKDFVGKDLINTLKNVDSSDIFTKKGWLDAYRKNYTTKGTVENEAHSVIAPKLEEEYRDIRSKQYDRLYGDMAMGGALPGAVGFTYARTVGAAPSNGKYTKKTKASAENGKEMSFYQQGLDWKPNNISRDGSVIKDDRGQWAYPGEITQINSNDITMQGVDYPVLGVSDTGDAKMMQPGEDYKFDGEKVTEYPMAQNGRNVATTADSARLYNSQIALNKFYENEMKAGRIKKSGNANVTRIIDNNLRDENLNFYRSEIKDRLKNKGRGNFDYSYKETFNISPEQVRQLENKGLGQTKGSSEYQEYYRDLVTPMQNLMSPFALLDKRIAPQRQVSYRPVGEYPGGEVMVYDYDPILIKPVNSLTPEERALRIKKYGKKSGIKETVSKPIQKPVSKPTQTPQPKPELPQVVAKQPTPQQPTPQPKPLYEYEGEQVMAQTPYGGGAAMVGVKKKDGTVEYIKPEDYQRMGVPKYGQDYIKSKQKMQEGGWLSKYPEPMRQDATRVAPSVLKLTDKEKLANVAKSDQAQKRALSTAKEVIAERTKNKATKGNLNTPGSWHTADKLRLSNIVPSTPGDAVDVFDEYLNIPRYVGSIADQMGEGIAKRDVGQIAGSVGEAALAGVLGIDPLTSVSKTPRKLLNAVDRNFSEVGQDLAHFEKIGRERGWSPQKIKEEQMKHVGITSNQREAYTPVLSNLAEKYITPYGYSGMQGESKIQQIINNIKKGGVKLPKTDNSLMRTEVSPERSDAWRLYLGKPQQHNTFRIANTSPVNHPSYTPEQLSKMDIYSINSDFSKLGIGPDTYSPNLISPRRIEENMAMLRNKINIDKGNEIMGGYNKRLNQYGLEYNDIWDLQPSIRPADYLPNSLKESSLFSKTSKEGVTSPRFFKIDASKVLGKPFMSHEVMPYTSTDLKNQMGYVFDEQLKHLKSSNFDMTPKINKIEAYKEELKNYPKYKQGGWLNKYK